MTTMAKAVQVELIFESWNRVVSDSDHGPEIAESGSVLPEVPAENE